MGDGGGEKLKAVGELEGMTGDQGGVRGYCSNVIAPRALLRKFPPISSLFVRSLPRLSATE